MRCTSFKRTDRKLQLQELPKSLQALGLTQQVHQVCVQVLPILVGLQVAHRRRLALVRRQERERDVLSFGGDVRLLGLEVHCQRGLVVGLRRVRGSVEEIEDRLGRGVEVALGVCVEAFGIGITQRRRDQF